MNSNPKSSRLLRNLRVSLVVLSLALVPFASTNSASAAPYFCGSQCNGKSPNWVIPANGIICAKSASVIAQGNPSGDYFHPRDGAIVVTDTTISVKVMYSSVCQTMWGVVTTTDAIGRVSCSSILDRTTSPPWSGSYTCPPSGTGSVATPMVDDHDPNFGIAASYTLSEIYPYARNPDNGYVHATFVKPY